MFDPPRESGAPLDVLDDYVATRPQMLQRKLEHVQIGAWSMKPVVYDQIEALRAKGPVQRV